MSIISLDPMTVPTEIKVAQLLIADQDMFMAPPITSAISCAALLDLGFYVWDVNSTSNFEVLTETTFALKCKFFNTTDVIIALTSNLSINELL